MGDGLWCMIWYKLPLSFVTCHLSDLYANYNRNHETLCGNSLKYKKQLKYFFDFCAPFFADIFFPIHGYETPVSPTLIRHHWIQTQEGKKKNKFDEFSDDWLWQISIFIYSCIIHLP